MNPLDLCCPQVTSWSFPFLMLFNLCGTTGSFTITSSRNSCASRCGRHPQAYILIRSKWEIIKNYLKRDRMQKRSIFLNRWSVTYNYRLGRKRRGGGIVGGGGRTYWPNVGAFVPLDTSHITYPSLWKLQNTSACPNVTHTSVILTWDNFNGG